MGVQTAGLISQGDLSNFVRVAAEAAGYEEGFGVEGCDLTKASWWAAYVRQSLEEQGYTEEKLKRLYTSRDMARGDGIVFVATGITDNAMLRGVRVNGHIARTHSIVMRARSRTIRYIDALHDLTRKTIHLQTEGAHARL